VIVFSVPCAHVAVQMAANAKGTTIFLMAYLFSYRKVKI
jgi:hypothetical protein